VGVSRTGRVDPGHLSTDIQRALMDLKIALANEGWIRGAQVTFDQVKVMDYPPTVDILAEPDGQG
jgi:hypothetical protein